MSINHQIMPTHSMHVISLATPVPTSPSINLSTPKLPKKMEISNIIIGSLNDMHSMVFNCWSLSDRRLFLISSILMGGKNLALDIKKRCTRCSLLM